MIARISDEYAELKRQGYKQLFCVEVGGFIFIYKPLTYLQYELCLNIEQELESATCNETLIKMSVLYPNLDKLDEWFDSPNAGKDPDILAEQILTNSKIKSKELILETYKEARVEFENNFINLVQIYICSAFSSIDPRDIINLPLVDIMNLLVRAEEMLGKSLDVNAILGLDKKSTKINLPIPDGFESTEFDHQKMQDLEEGFTQSPIPGDAFGPPMK